MSVREHFDITGEIIHDAWKDYTANFWRIAVIAIAIAAPFGIATIAVGHLFKTNALAIGVIDLAIAIAALPFYALEAAMIYRLLDMGRKNDPEKGFQKALCLGWNRYFLLVTTLLLLTAALFIAALLCFIPLFALLAISFIGPIHAFARPLIFAGLLISLPLELCVVAWLGVKLSLTIAACVFEGWGPIRSVIRSFVMTSGSFWILLMAFATAWIAGYVLYMPFLIVLRNSHGIGSVLIQGLGCIMVTVAFAFVKAIAYRAYIRLSGEDY